MADATSTFTVKGTADVNSLIRGLNSAGESAENAEKKADGFGTKIKDIATGVFSAQLAMEAFKKATEFATKAISDAIAADSTLSANAEVTTTRLTEMSSAFGDIIIGGENGATAIAELNSIIEFINDNLRDFGGQGTIATQAIDLLSGSVVAGSYIADAFSIAWDGVQIAISGIINITEILALGVLNLGRALVEVAGLIGGQVLIGFSSLLEGSVSLAESLGAGGLLPEGVRTSIQSIRSLGENLVNTSDPLDTLQQGIIGVGLHIGDFQRDIDENTNSIMETISAGIEFRESFSSLTPTVLTASDSVSTFTGAVAESTEEIEQWNFEVDKFMTFMNQPFIDPKMHAEALADKARGEMEAVMEEMAEQKRKLSVLIGMNAEGAENEGFGFGRLLGKDYDAMKEFSSSIGDVAGGLGNTISSGFGAALQSTENFGKAFKTALGQSLISQGTSEILTGISNMIPFGPMFNPIAGTARIAAGTAMLGAGRLMGGKGGSGGTPSGGGSRSVGEYSGMPVAEPAKREGPVNLVDYTGVTIVTNDTDSMRTLINQTSRTEQLGGNSRV